MNERELRGIAAAAGTVEGVAWLYRARGAASGPPPEVGTRDEESQRLEQAKRAVNGHLTRLSAEFIDDQREVAAIFDAQALMLTDPGLNECMLELIEEGFGAEEAVRRCGERFSFQLQRAPSAPIRDRAADCREVTDRLLGMLSHETAVRAEADLAGRVVIARELPPGDAVWLLRAGAVALVIEHGGTTSHTAIVARALGVPAVVGIEDPLDAIPPNTSLHVDGDRGVVTVLADRAKPSSSPPSDRETPPSDQVTTIEMPIDHGPCETGDGCRIHLAANVELPEELALLGVNGAEGIGLYRSEFLLIETDPELPDERLQVERYRQLLSAAAPHEVVVRTYDLGGRKLAREVMATREEHPSLGLRGIRILDLRRHLFETQVRALLRATDGDDDGRDRLKILLPMISNVAEIVHFRDFLSEVASAMALDGPLPAVGAMIETPAAALISESLGRVADFLAIGTNDLVQYTLAAERDNEHVADIYQPYHPAVLKLLRAAVEGAQAAGVPLSVCGEMASEARGQAILCGLGLRRLSLHPARIASARGLLPGLDCRKLTAVAERCLAAVSAEETIEILQRSLDESGAAATNRGV